MPIARNRFSLLPLILLLLPAMAVARPDYRIEIILFENVEVPADPNERWHPAVTIPTLEQAVAFNRDDSIRADRLADLPEGFVAVDSDELRLMKEREALERSRRYEVLVHKAWIQPPLDGQEAIDVRVHAGEPMIVDLPLDERSFYQAFGIHGRIPSSPDDPADGNGIDESTDRAAPIDAEGDQPQALEYAGRRYHEPRQRLTAYPLDGTVRLVVRRYLHIHTDLYWTQQADWVDPIHDLMPDVVDTPPSMRNGERRAARAAAAPDIAIDPEGRPLISYPVRLQRRMRSGELHYLDHPMIGMLVLVTRHEREQDDD